MKKLRTALQLLWQAWRNYERDYARYFAVAIVYYALISLVPLLLLLLGSVGLLLRASPTAAAMEQHALTTIELSFGVQLREVLEQSLGWLQQESLPATVISLAGLLLTSSVLFRHLRMTFRAIWNYAPPLASGSLQLIVWKVLLERLISFLIVVAAGAVLLLVLGVMAAIQWTRVMPSVFPVLSGERGWLAALPGPLIAALLTFALLFKVLPPVHIAWRHLWPASVLCAAVWLIGAELLTLYGSYLGSNMGAYGALSGILVLMLWMKIMSQALFYGAELCKVISQPPSSPASIGSIAD